MVNSGSMIDSSERAPFNLTQPIPYDELDNLDRDEDIDKYGYIANENRNVEIHVYRYPDDSLSFVALDEDGVEVSDYQLPDEYTLESLEIKPMSKYATDRYGRKYPVIDIDNRVDISDIDDEYYDTIDTDDKYNN